jgi:hypothetical protein
MRDSTPDPIQRRVVMHRPLEPHKFGPVAEDGRSDHQGTVHGQLRQQRCVHG